MTQQANIDRLVQDRSKSSALAMELMQSCTKPSTYVCFPQFGTQRVKINNKFLHLAH